MGCNTSKETVQPTDEEKDKNENDPGADKVEENNVNEAKEQNEEKPPSAKTVTIKSAPNSKPNSAAPAGTKEEEATEAIEEEDDPDLEHAATKIQAAFRGHQSRRTMKQEDKSAKPKSAQPQPPEEFENDFTTEDAELTHAATKIQASFRGHMVRKQKEGEPLKNDPPKPTPAEEELDIDLTDPELNKAATKIQASFRGHAVRKEPAQPTSSAK